MSLFGIGWDLCLCCSSLRLRLFRWYVPVVVFPVGVPSLSIPKSVIGVSKNEEAFIVSRPMLYQVYVLFTQLLALSHRRIVVFICPRLQFVVLKVSEYLKLVDRLELE